MRMKYLIASVCVASLFAVGACGNKKAEEAKAAAAAAAAIGCTGSAGRRSRCPAGPGSCQCRVGNPQR